MQNVYFKKMLQFYFLLRFAKCLLLYVPPSRCIHGEKDLHLNIKQLSIVWCLTDAKEVSFQP